MSRIRVDAPIGSPAIGASEEGAYPARVESHPLRATEAAKPRFSVARTALRIVRDALIAVAFMAMVPIGFVAVKGTAFTRSANFSEYIHRVMVKTERWRPLALPHDASITAEQAGLAYAAIQPVIEGPGFVPRPGVHPLGASWRDAAITSNMFLDAPPDLYHLPATKKILEAAQKGFTPAELEYLRTLASAPVWHAYDLVARAPAADILGGQFRIPFGSNAYSELRPLEYKAVREISSAAVSRAAYHLAMGQRDSAETILRTIVSFGFALVDNGTTTMDEGVGNQIVDIGRVALRQFYEIQHDPRVAATTLGNTAKAKFGSNVAVSSEEFRAAQIARLADPAAHRGERFESVDMLARSSCTNVPELLMGPRSDVTAAIANARRDLARYPSERALIDMMGRTIPPNGVAAYYNPVSELAVSAATVAGTVLHNPRLAACTRILTMW